jgi:hypothetical protein
MNYLLSLYFTILISCYVAASPLYEANIKMPDKSDHAWRNGLQSIACQVFIKVSGKTNVCQIIPINAELKDIEEKISQFHYHHQDESLWLTIAFDPGFIDQTLHKYHQPIWKTARPKTLLWLVLEKDHQNMRSYEQIIKNESHLRGIEVSTPIYDFEDTQGLQASTPDLINVIKTRSQKYHTSNLIIGIENNDHIQWHLLSEDNHIEWTAPSKNMSSAIANIIEHTADFYAEENADYDVNHGHDALFIEIYDVYTYTDYIKALTKLKTIPDIQEIETVEFHDHHLLIHLTVKNGVSAFASHLEKINHFALNTGSNYFDRSNMSYQWINDLKQS